MRIAIKILMIALFCGASGPAAIAVAPYPSFDEDAHLTHEAYVTAINSNDLATLLGMLTEDVVFLSPNQPVIVGKAAVRLWLEAYLKAFKTHWDKPVQEFVVSGNWAFERYSFKSSDTPIGAGPVGELTGWGLVIYHHDADGKWRVARDAWGSDHPLPPR
jgi:ketosteroid isomerase-like protein